MYALKDKHKYTFSCWAATEKFLNKRVNSSFWSWRACQQKDSNKTIDDFMLNRVKVRITIEEI